MVQFVLVNEVLVARLIGLVAGLFLLMYAFGRTVVENFRMPDIVYLSRPCLRIDLV